MHCNKSPKSAKTFRGFNIRLIIPNRTYTRQENMYSIISENIFSTINMFLQLTWSVFKMSEHGNFTLVSLKIEKKEIESVIRQKSGSISFSVVSGLYLPLSWKAMKNQQENLNMTYYIYIYLKLWWLLLPRQPWSVMHCVFWPVLGCNSVT